MQFFEELSSSPAAMAAAKAADIYGLIPGHAAEQADAMQAYAQAKLNGTDTWVRLPKDRWPKAWIDAKMIDPVCPPICRSLWASRFWGALGNAS